MFCVFSIGLLNQSKLCELPSKVGMEKIPVRWPEVVIRRGNRAASQNFLIDHKFSIVFPKGARGFLITRVGQISGLSPFPPATTVKSGGCHLPFELCGKPHSFPLGIGRCFIVGYMSDRCRWF